MIQRRAERKGRTGESRNSRLEPSGCLDDHPADLAFITGNSAMLCMSSWRCLCVKAWGDKVVCKLNITPITQEKYGKVDYTYLFWRVRGGFGMLFGRTPYLSHEQVEFAQFAELLSRPPPAVHSAVRGSWKRVPKKLTSPC